MCYPMCYLSHSYKICKAFFPLFSIVFKQLFWYTMVKDIMILDEHGTAVLQVEVSEQFDTHLAFQFLYF